MIVTTFYTIIIKNGDACRSIPPPPGWGRGCAGSGTGNVGHGVVYRDTWDGGRAVDVAVHSMCDNGRAMVGQSFSSVAHRAAEAASMGRDGGTIA